MQAGAGPDASEAVNDMSIDVWRGVRRGSAGFEFFVDFGYSPTQWRAFRRRRHVAADVR